MSRNRQTVYASLTYTQEVSSATEMSNFKALVFIIQPASLVKKHQTVFFLPFNELITLLENKNYFIFEKTLKYTLVQIDYMFGTDKLKA